MAGDGRTIHYRLSESLPLPVLHFHELTHLQGAFTGTIIGIAIQEFSKRGDSLASGAVDGAARGLFGTDLTAGDLVLPWTAGTFLYVGFSSLPEILETGKNRREEIRKSLTQLMAMAAGFAVMFFISD